MNKTSSDQREIWNLIADEWKRYKDKAFPGVCEFMKNKSGKVLDLGCGSGRNFQCIPKNCTLYATDFSENMLKLAMKTSEKLNLETVLSISEASNLSFEDNTFDTAIFVAALHCIESEAKRKKALQELFRVLKPGAEAFISVWSKNQARINGKSGAQYIPWTAKGIKVQRYYYIYDKDEFTSLLKSVGFEILSIKEDDNIVAIVKKN